MTIMLEDFKVVKAPSTVFYIPEFLTVGEERSLFAQISRTPGPRWTQLANRRLQNWGGVPHPKGMIAEALPSWLQVVPYPSPRVYHSSYAYRFMLAK